jgi:CRP/FNR family cyclic AMP-dependent transcriptional regulator
MDRRELLANVSIFGMLDERELQVLLDLTTTRRLAAKESLFRKGDPGNRLYGVLSGRLKVMASAPDGKEMVFGVMGPGEVIGEIALVDSNPRSASVVALEPAELLTLHRRDLVPFLQQHPNVAIQLASVLARRLRRLSEKAEDTVFLALPARMAKTLVALIDSYKGAEGEGEGGGGDSPVEIRLAQQDLADMLGTTRETVNKQLRLWEDESILELKRARISVLRRDALTAISDLVDI